MTPTTPPLHLDTLLTQHLQTFLGELEPEAMALLRDKLEWVELAGGRTLIEQGAPGDSMYLVVSGRLRAYVKRADGTQRMVREMARGQIVGEMSLYTGEPRSATVVAVRDSVLVRLDKPQFDRLIASSAQVSVALARQIIKRLQNQEQHQPLAVPVVIGVLPITAGVDLAAFSASLALHMSRAGRVRVVDSAAIDQNLGEPGVAQLSGADPQANRRIAMLLDLIEAENDFMLLVADDSATAWTQCCSRHCDELLLLADATAPPVLHAIETECLMQDGQQPQRTEAAQVLVLLHAADTHSPRHTAQWLARRPLADHVHIRPALARDMARLARLQSRTAVGLALAGGGARGVAHLGVARALQERGIEVDCIGGTSIGAVMAALLAADQPLDRAIAVARRAFSGNPTGDYNFLPVLSLIKGLRLRHIVDHAVHELLGFDADFEDLWKNCFCITTNYSQAEEHPLRHGNLAKLLRASAAIPGALPPVVHLGDLLCDGGTFNNFPVDVMRGMRGVGRVIGSDLNFKTLLRMDSDDVPSNWALLRDRFRRSGQRRFRLPTLATYLVNVTILYSMSRRRQAQRLADVYFNPPLDRVGLLQWSRFDHIVEQGHAHAVEVLDRAANEPGKA